MLKKIDFFFNKVIPKKLLVWIVATLLVYAGKVDGETWGIISCIYLGVNIAGKFVNKNNLDGNS